VQPLDDSTLASWSFEGSADAVTLDDGGPFALTLTPEGSAKPACTARSTSARATPWALALTLDGGATVTSAWPIGGVVKNDEAVCLGAFADGARGFVGDLDLVRVGSRPIALQ
jgi:hypothetical protein